MSEQSRWLGEFDVSADLVPEILRYATNPYRGGIGRLPSTLPLADEPHLEAWRDYASEAASAGVAVVLARKLAQLRFPIQEGISRRAAYRNATLRGAHSPTGTGLRLQAPQELRLAIHPTVAGHIPVLVADNRTDFETLVRALAGRNEPIPVPSTMGACLVKGLINWDRVARYRAAWNEKASSSDSTWQDEFRRLRAHKELYQDRVLLLSTGAYSAVTSAEVRLAEEAWRSSSLLIRREHECFHYLTLRLFDSIRSNLLDEILADAAGLLAAYGDYDQDLALRFLGLDRYPERRPDARIEIYRGDPPLSSAAMAVLARIAVTAIDHLQRIVALWDGEPRDNVSRAGLLLVLADMGLAEIAAAESTDRFAARWAGFSEERQLPIRMEP